MAISNVSPNNREISQNSSCIKLSTVSPKQHLSEILSKSVAQLFSRHSYYIILFHFSRFFHFPPAFHFLCISLWHCAISSLRVRFLLRCCAISTETRARLFIGGSSSHVPGLSLLRYCSLPLPLTLRCLGAWGLVQRGMRLSFYPHLQLYSFNFWI